MPLAGSDSTTVTVSVWPKSTLLMATLPNGVIGASSVVPCGETTPVMTGGSFTAVATMLPAALAVAPAVSVTSMVKPVAIVSPGAT